MRTKARVDSNHAEIVAALRAHGCRVQSLASVGKGCPDLLVGRCGRLVLLEVKDGAKPPSERTLTVDERLWHAYWSGLPVYVVDSVEAALKATE